MSVLRSVTLFESAEDDVALAVVLVTDEVTLAALAPWKDREREREREKEREREGEERETVREIGGERERERHTERMRDKET